MTPVGPFRCVPSPSRGEDAIASRASRFLTTLYCAETARSCLRSSLSCCTVRPRYSVRTTVFTPASRSLRSSTAATFSWVGTLRSLLLEQVRSPLGVDRDARPHRGGHRQRAKVRALGCGRLRPHNRLDDRQCVGAQLLGRERSFADGYVDVAGLIHPELDLAGLRLAHSAPDVEG